MRPRLHRYPAVRHRPEDFADGLPGCTQLVLEHLLPVVVQHAIPTPTIPEIQSHGVFLLPKASGLLACHSDTLPHCRSPFRLRLERVSHWELIASRWETGILIPSGYDNHSQFM